MPTLPTETLKANRKAGGDDRRAGRQTVHVVEQIEGVGDADDPQDGQRNGDRREPGRFDLDAADDQHAGGQDLGDEFGVRPQMAEVVDQAGDEQDRAADYQTQQARVVMRERR